MQRSKTLWRSKPLPPWPSPFPMRWPIRAFHDPRLYRLIQSDDLPSLRVGGRRMIRRDALDAFFDRLTDKAA